MTDAQRALAGLAAAIAARDAQALEDAVDRVGASAAAAAVEEVLLQSYLFVGFPVALEAVRVWRERSGTDAPTPAPEDPAVWPERGRAVCATVYGGQYDRLRANVARLHPSYERWMLEEGYGKVLGRSELDLRTRELCIVAQLAALGVPTQLYSHLRGALHTGASPADVAAALAEAAKVTTRDRMEEAMAVWTAVQTRSQSGSA